MHRTLLTIWFIAFERFINTRNQRGVVEGHLRHSILSWNPMASIKRSIVQKQTHVITRLIEEERHQGGEKDREKDQEEDIT